MTGSVAPRSEKSMADDLLGDAFSTRPDNDELAFVYFENMFREQLDATVKDLENESAYNHYMQTYINSVIATIKALELPYLEYWINNPADANQKGNFQQIKFDIASDIIQIKIRHAQIKRKTSVRLEGEIREKVRDLIGKIKTTLEATELPLARKEALMAKLNAFAAEVDRDRTKFEAFGALAIEAAGTVSRAEAKLRPIRKWIDSIANLLRQARVFEDANPRLPAPVKRVQAPTKQISPPSGSPWKPPKGGDLDDEIPF